MALAGGQPDPGGGREAGGDRRRGGPADHDYRRNVLEDYRRAFGEEPWDIVAVGLMTDTDNTRQKAHCLYGDISFSRAAERMQ